MAHADMPEGVEHALMAENAVGDGELIARIGESVGHGMSLGLVAKGPQAKPKGAAVRKRDCHARPTCRVIGLQGEPDPSGLIPGVHAGAVSL